LGKAGDGVRLKDYLVKKVKVGAAIKYQLMTRQGASKKNTRRRRQGDERAVESMLWLGQVCEGGVI